MDQQGAKVLVAQPRTELGTRASRVSNEPCTSWNDGREPQAVRGRPRIAASTPSRHLPSDAEPNALVQVVYVPVHDLRLAEDGRKRRLPRAQGVGMVQTMALRLDVIEHQQPFGVESVQEVAGRERRIVEVFEDRRHDDHVEARDALEAGQRLAELGGTDGGELDLGIVPIQVLGVVEQFAPYTIAAGVGYA